MWHDLDVMTESVMTNVLASLSTLLAFAELIGTVGVPALLVIALVRKRHLITTALVAAIVFGVVFANPFGAVAEPSSEDARSLTPSSTQSRNSLLSRTRSEKSFPSQDGTYPLSDPGLFRARRPPAP